MFTNRNSFPFAHDFVVMRGLSLYNVIVLTNAEPCNSFRATENNMVESNVVRNYIATRTARNV